MNTLKEKGKKISSRAVFFASMFLFLASQVIFIYGIPNNYSNFFSLFGVLLSPFLIGGIITIPIYFLSKQNRSFLKSFYKIASITYIVMMIFTIIGS